MTTSPPRSTRARFGCAVAVFPVIHLDFPAQAAEEFLKALDAGARGAFLVDHGAPHRTMRTLDGLAAMREAAERAGHRAAWLGVNVLGRLAAATCAFLRRHARHDVQGVWADGAGLGSDDAAATVRAVTAAQAETPCPVLFAGFAFKGQPDPVHFAPEARRVAEVYDVLTTSGVTTGVAPDVDKVRRIRAAIGPDVPLALASGVAVDNARTLVEAGADVLLVATSLAQDGSFYRMDPAKLRALLRAVGP